MHLEKLRAAVAELERQLGGSGTLDDESRQALQEALRDIRSALHEDQQTDAERQSLIERLRVAVERFEGAHPTLTGTFMRLIDGLGEMGI
jgi:signal transduction histidine kinase